MTSQVRVSGRLAVDASLCHGCQACMVACSLVKEGRVLPSRARVQVVLDPLEARQVIRYCRQCRRAACAEACPHGAIRLAEGHGYWAVDAALCDGCGACVAACPFEAMVLPGVKCDTCDGAPECVESCPSGALSWSPLHTPRE